MKKLILITSFILIKTALIFSQCPGGLFFSEYIEGSSSNKALEIYNPTKSAVNLVDYELHLFQNGSSTNNQVLALTGVLQPDSVLVLANSSANTAILSKADIIDGIIIIHNGNDAYALINVSTVDTVDIIGIIGNDPGSNGWTVGSGSTKDNTLIRNYNVIEGTTNWTLSSTQWLVKPKDFTDSLGSHTSDSIGPKRDTLPLTTLCNGDSAKLFSGAVYYKVAGTYSDTTDLGDCDSITTAELAFVSEYRDTLAVATICEGDSSELFSNGVFYKVAGTYSNTLTATGGCDSITVRELIVNPTLRDTLAVETICEGDSSNLFSDGTYYKLAGVYSDTTTTGTSNNCDSITVRELIVNPTLRDTLAVETICEGDSSNLFSDGIYYKVAGVYSDTTTTGTSNNCDSITVRELIVNPTLRDTLAVETICEGDSSNLFSDGTYYKLAGIYSDTTTTGTSNNCDSITVRELIVNPILRDTLAVATICVGDSSNLFSDGIYYKVAGVYSDTTTTGTSNNCDSITVRELIVNPILRDTLAVETICEGDSSNLFSDGTYYKLAGIYSDTTTTGTSNNCDSITVRELIVNPILRDTLAVETICEGDSSNLFSDGTYYKLAGVYSDTTTTGTSNNCDSITVRELIVKPLSRDTLMATTICEGDSSNLFSDGIYYKLAGVYSDTTTTGTSNNCDSITVRELIVNPILRDTLVVERICEGDSSNLFSDGTYYKLAGVYSDTTTTGTSNNCDSITVRQLIVDTTVIDSISQTICEGDTAMVGSSAYTMTGTYDDTLSTSVGCDSIVILDLTVTPLPRDTLAITHVCEGDSVDLFSNGIFYKLAGTYSDTAENGSASGCDSITVGELVVDTTVVDSISQTICEGDTVMVGSSAYTTTGTYNDTIVGGALTGCDSVVVLDLIVNLPSRDTLMTTTICEGDSSELFSNGDFYKVAGIYNDTTPGGSANGCDSITVRELIVNPTYNDTLTPITICNGDSTMIFGVWRDTAGFYVDSSSTILGCDSVTVQELIVNLYVQDTLAPISICDGDSAMIGSMWYNTSGWYTDTVVTAGCDTIHHVELIVNPHSTSSVTDELCPGDSVMIGGTWYSSPTTVIDTIPGASSMGCDSIVTHHVVYNRNTRELNLGPDVVACVDGSVTLIAPTYYTSYMWSDGSTSNTTVVDGAILGIGVHQYILTATDPSTGCNTTDTVLVEFVSCVGVNEITPTINLSIYPNPVQEWINIEATNNTISTTKKLEIIGLDGKLKYSSNVIEGNRITLSTAQFTSGMYLVRLVSDYVIITKKLIVK